MVEIGVHLWYLSSQKRWASSSRTFCRPATQRKTSMLSSRNPLIENKVKPSTTISLLHWKPLMCTYIMESTSMSSKTLRTSSSAWSWALTRQPSRISILSNKAISTLKKKKRKRRCKVTSHKTIRTGPWWLTSLSMMPSRGRLSSRSI